MGQLEPNNNGYVRKWQLVATWVGLFVAIGGILFRAGVNEAQLESKIAAVERHVEYDDSVLARKDVLDQRLLNIEEGEKKIELLQREQNDALERLVLGEYRRK